MIDENKIQKNHDIVIVTYRLEDNKNFRPAEEILIRLILAKLNLNYEKIEHNSAESSNIFGRLPCLYFDGKLIVCKNIPNFIKDLIILNKDDDFNLHYESLLFLLRDQLRSSNEYYFYIKNLQKLENKKKSFNFYKKYLARNKSYEIVMDELLNSFANIKYNLSAEDKIVEVNKYVYSTLDRLKNKTFNERNKNFLIQFLVYSYLEADNILMVKIKRPAIDSLKHEESQIFSSIGTYYNKIAGLKNENFTFKTNENLETILDSYAMVFNPKAKKKQIKVNEIINQRTLTYNIVSISIFLGLGLLIFYFSNRQRRK